MKMSFFRFTIICVLCLFLSLSALAEKQVCIGTDYEPGWYCLKMGDAEIHPEYFPEGTILNLPDDAVLTIDEEETHRQELLHLGDDAKSSADRYQATAVFSRKIGEIDFSATPVYAVKGGQTITTKMDIPVGWYNIYYLGESDAKMELYRNASSKEPYEIYAWSNEQGTNTVIYEAPIPAGVIVIFASEKDGEFEKLWMQRISDL